ncbi:unnamed protein product [Prorocentrum cordatum]|uniref:Uncharacterized protein n=1 Tax=Prorocentrum cordatum TaxID=2364126 RepID=A0ABN9WFX1_9DINO|nr:unnamed protein product [Polarella glacialis]
MASRAAARDAPGPLKAGSGVWAFYHAPSHRQGFRYVRLLESEEGGRPAEAAPGAGTVGLSTGWVEATVAEDWRPAEGGGKSAQVVVHLRGFFADPYRPDPEPVDCMYWKLGRGLVRPLDESRPPVELSLFVARWWQYDNPEARARSHNILHKGLMEDVLEGKGSPHEAFGTAGQYEVYTAFVRGGEDLDALGEGLAAQLHSRRRAALYFLWPSQRLGRERFAAGYVAERSLTGLMRRMEAGGVRPGPPGEAEHLREPSAVDVFCLCRAPRREALPAVCWALGVPLARALGALLGRGCGLDDGRQRVDLFLQLLRESSDLADADVVCVQECYGALLCPGGYPRRLAEGAAALGYVHAVVPSRCPFFPAWLALNSGLLILSRRRIVSFAELAFGIHTEAGNVNRGAMHAELEGPGDYRQDTDALNFYVTYISSSHNTRILSEFSNTTSFPTDMQHTSHIWSSKQRSLTTHVTEDIQFGSKTLSVHDKNSFENVHNYVTKFSRHRAGTKAGPKKRNYLAFPSVRPASDHYCAALGKPATDGGLAATPTHLSIYVSSDAAAQELHQRPENDIHIVGEYRVDPALDSLLSAAQDLDAMAKRLMTLARIATFKLRSAHIPHLAKSYDMRNAFGTGDTDRLLAAHRVRTDDPHFEDMLTQHRLRATMRIDASDDIIGLHPGSGGRMGDSNEPELFMESFYPLIIDWGAGLNAVIGDGLICTNPITGTAHRIDMGAFIDDIARAIVVPDGALRQALAIDCIDVSSTNAKLRHGGYAQNAHKQETLVRLATSNATKQAERQLSGTCMTNLIHPGSYIHVDGYNTREDLLGAQAAPMGDDLRGLWDIDDDIRKIFRDPEIQEAFQQIDFSY